MDAPSFDDLFRIARDEVLVRNAKVSREAVEREGTDANILVASGVAAADEVGGQLVITAASLFLDSAESEALDRLVFDRYGLLRKPAAPALGSANFTTTASNPSPFTIPSGTTLQTSDGIQFVTTIDATFPSMSTGPVIVPIRSSLAGLSQQAQANSITSIISAITGQPSDLVVNNPLATSGAADAELDDSLRDRARRFFTTARRGTIAAIEAGALAVPGVQTATAFEALDGLGRPARFVELVVSDAFTDQLADLTVVPPAYQTQSQALAAAVFAGLSDVRPAGIFVQVHVAIVKLLSIHLRLSFVANNNIDEVAIAARAAIVDSVNTLNPGETLTITRLIDALKLVDGLLVMGSEIASPAGDVIPRSLEVIRTTLGLVTAISAQPDRPLTQGNNPDAFIVI